MSSIVEEPFAIIRTLLNIVAAEVEPVKFSADETWLFVIVKINRKVPESSQPAWSARLNLMSPFAGQEAAELGANVASRRAVM